jgi:hypothetical protein
MALLAHDARPGTPRGTPVARPSCLTVVGSCRHGSCPKAPQCARPKEAEAAPSPTSESTAYDESCAMVGASDSTSDALDLQSGVFKLKEAKSIAASLKRSAERSGRRKASPYRSALSMLVFYINRAGRNLPATRAKPLNRRSSSCERFSTRNRREDPAAPHGRPQPEFDLVECRYSELPSCWRRAITHEFARGCENRRRISGI